jgi:hypothetical protein
LSKEKKMKKEKKEGLRKRGEDGNKGGKCL